jgi:hypothetical protein
VRATARTSPVAFDPAFDVLEIAKPGSGRARASPASGTPVFTTVWREPVPAVDEHDGYRV